MDHPSTLAIETATQADLETILDYWVRLATNQQTQGSHVLPEPNRETMCDILAAYRLDDGLLVARLEGTVVGFASFSVEHGSLELDTKRGLLSNLYVDPDYRGRGIGTALLERVEESLADRGVEVLMLEAMAENEAAQRFYRRHGYETYRVGMERSLEETEKNETENDTHSKEER